MAKLNELSITEAAAKMRAGEITAVDLARACLAEIEAKNKELNIFLEVFDDVIAQAEAADTRRKAGESHDLLGIPLAIKDNILIEGRKVSAASKMLENYVATYDATVIKKLKEAGAVFIGRTNMDEFAMGGSTENSAYGATKNPVDPTRVPGGSSGGSAAAVAAHMALGSLGTDTGGSIREPAAFCGLVGFKPTYGAVSRSGLIAMGSSLDQAGPLTHTVADAELLFNVIKGKDTLDSTTIKIGQGPTLTQGSSRSDLKLKKRIGVPRDLLKEGVEPDVLAAFEKSLESLQAKGFEIVDVSLPSAPLALSVYYVIMPAEVSSNLARFDGVRYGLSLKGNNLFDDYAKSRAAGFGPEVRRRIMLGTYVLSAGYYDAYYGKALAAREMLTKEFADVLAIVDAIAVPTTPCPAIKIGEKSDPLSMYLLDIFTVTANITGNPAISIPMGTVERPARLNDSHSGGEGKQLPVGIQLTAAHGAEDILFTIGKELQ
ncbi:MAG TPA: Asp-tRNA(Asn)/Glu-tRNA(Gln) amidotransferase subunit GatA [Candidatus Paceibacterota bacterium]|nr:Asp-tRNA(Asn)/Glu-tRNA(Gln) amidotransferase subunit GatA [Candidatus Paceibacterota bacterium]